MREQRRSYDDAAQIWIGGVRQFEVHARLTGYEDVIETQTAGGVIRTPGVRSWDGFLSGLSEVQLVGLLSKELELKLQNGRSGSVWLADSTTGFVRGSGETPF